MLHNITLVSTISLFLLATASAKAEPPTIDELRDPVSTTHGLYLDKVAARAKFVLDKHIKYDISTKIVVFRGNKKIMGRLNKEKLSLLDELKSTKNKKSLVPSTRKKLKVAIKNLTEKINTINVKLLGYEEVQTKLGRKIMDGLDLNSTQLAHIPPLSAE
ncbi:MAG TPA: hypothetical protein DD412_06970 [Holosporales bacterium]|nr:hypothetical protein [Holosporales bacterium]